MVPLPQPAAAAARAPLVREIRVLIAAAFVIAVGYGLVAPVLPQFAHSFDVSISAAALVISAFAFTRLLFAPVSGQLVERFGERWIYVSGILIVAASSAACAFAHTYWQLLVFRGLGGVGSTMFTVAAMGLLVRLAPPTSRGRITSAYAGSFLLGNIAGPAIGGLLAGFGLQLPFLVYAAALLLAAAVVATQLHPTMPLPEPGAGGAAPSGTANAVVNAPLVPGREPLAQVNEPPAPAQKPMGLSEALKSRAYRAALVSAFSNGWSAFGIRMALVPLFATVALGGGPEVAGLSLTVFAVGTGAALTFSGKLADSWGRRPMVIAGLAVNSTAMAVLGLTSSIPVFLIVSAIAGIGSGLLGPAQQAAVADVIGNNRSGGKVLATFQMSQDFGTILGPIAAGIVVDAFSYGPAFGLAGIVGAFALVVWFLAKEALLGKAPEDSAPA
ncbi:MFS transporter [Paenarthrobacter sp. Z7-10]|uniref:MFS transporter n=1 Tax=Paenarthrobacter sp. Z7-10 TaxID=2787635 RepID=UPI0022A9C6EB|nr:MFS transporter [Paenarthrobacter sp. Z7-10]MCZ2403893.1 MFS transporter [Paenarthrobacter sp. Z7-10]